MKTVLNSILLLILFGSAQAEPFKVARKVLEVPSPEGFALVTPEMDAAYRLSLQMADPRNDLLAAYIPESDIPAAMSGELPSFERYFLLKVTKRLRNNTVVGSKEFGELKDSIKQEVGQIQKLVEELAPGLLEETSKGISKEFDVDYVAEFAQVIPFDHHYETDNALAYSMYLTVEETLEGASEYSTLSVTTTHANVAGKVIFLYCYGPQEELEWTRSASKAWAEMVMDSNARPPSQSQSPGKGIFDGRSMLKDAVVGAIVGGLTWLLIARFRKKAKTGNGVNL